MSHDERTEEITSTADEKFIADRLVARIAPSLLVSWYLPYRKGRLDHRVESQAVAVATGVTADGRPVRPELARLGVMVLNGDVLEPRLVGDHELDHHVQVAGHLRAVLLDERGPRTALEHRSMLVICGARFCDRYLCSGDGRILD